MHRLKAHNGCGPQWEYHCCRKRYLTAAQAKAHLQLVHGRADRPAQLALQCDATDEERAHCRVCQQAQRQRIRQTTGGYSYSAWAWPRESGPAIPPADADTDLLAEWDWWNYRDVTLEHETPYDPLRNGGEAGLLAAIYLQARTDALHGTGEWRLQALDWLLAPSPCGVEYCCGVPQEAPAGEAERDSLPRARGAGFRVEEVLAPLGIDPEAARQALRRALYQQEEAAHAEATS